MKSILLLLICTFVYSCSSVKNGNLEFNPDYQTIYLVRHAEKVDDGTRNPPLTKEGQDRAEKLKDLLLQTDIEAIYSSDYKRTKETAQPLAEALGKEIIIYDPRTPEKTKEILFQSDKNMLVVGHSNSTPTLVNTILSKKEYEQLPETEYSTLFIIEKKGDDISSRIVKF